MNVHADCQKKVANLCGINQKLLAEALSQVSQVCTVKQYVNIISVMSVYILCQSVLKNICTNDYMLMLNLSKLFVPLEIYQEV